STRLSGFVSIGPGVWTAIARMEFREDGQSRGAARSHFAIYSLARFQPRPAKLVSTLQIQPEFGRSTEESRQPERGVGRHSTLFVENCGDSIHRDTQGLRHGARRKSHLLQLTAQDLAWVNRPQVVRHCRLSFSDSQLSRHCE